MWLSWKPPASTGGSPITSYKAFNADSDALACTSTTTSCQVQGLTNGDSYAFYVEAQNARGMGPASSTSARIVAATAPSAPRNIGVGVGHFQASVAWAPPLSNGGADIHYYLASTVQDPTKSCITSSLTCVITGLVGGQTYSIQVVAVNGKGVSQPVVSGRFYVVPDTVPSPPRNIGVGVGDGQASVAWSPPTSNGGADIHYYLASTVQDPTKSCITSSLSCVITGLTDGQTYSVQVVAVNGVGSSSPVVSGLFTPRPQPSVVLTFSGNGDQSGPAFTIPGYSTRWTESYNYDCSSFGFEGNFITYINGLNGTLTFDSGANALGMNGSSTNTYFDTGTFNIDVISECNWNETITFYPPGS